MSVKDLKYYLANTDEMPNDPKELERLANEHMEKALENNGNDLTIDRFEEKDDKAVAPSSEKEPKEPEAKVEEPKEEVKEEIKEEKPEGVLAKDGKNLIPYAVLASARDRAEAAESLAAEQATELERLRAGVKAPAQQTETLSDEELNALAEESPTLAKILKSQQAVIQSLTGKVEELSDHTQRRAAAEAADVKTEIQLAIDANPKLLEWQVSDDQSMWDKSAAFDKVLRELPEYKDVSFEERFKKVVQLTQSAIGEEPAPIKEPTLTQDQIKELAEKKLSKTKAIPRSLSDIPGGAPPAVDERQKLEDMSSVALGQQFQSMTREQLDTYLSGI